MNHVIRALSQYTEEHLEYSYLARLGYFPLERSFDQHWDQFLQSLEEGQRKQLEDLYEEPVEPKPPAPRPVSSSSSTSSSSGRATGTTISWAIRSPGSTV